MLLRALVFMLEHLILQLLIFEAHNYNISFECTDSVMRSFTN